MSTPAESMRRILLRVVPIGFALGAAMEYFMVKVTVGSESFYETALRLEAERRAAKDGEIEAAKERIRKAKANAEQMNDPEGSLAEK